MFDYDDAKAGMEWWNSLTELERAWWLGKANSAAAADAWAAYKKAPAPTPFSKRAIYPCGEHVMLHKRGVCANGFIATGERRKPRKGEWYLSGAVVAAYRAPNDLDIVFAIAVPNIPGVKRHAS